MFAEDALYYMEDLLYMPDRCFRFYVVAVCRYLMSNDSKGDSDGASSFLSHIQFRPHILIGTPSLQIVLDTIHHISSRQTFYDASYECYGSFAEQCKQAIHTLGG